MTAEVGGGSESPTGSPKPEVLLETSGRGTPGAADAKPEPEVPTGSGHLPEPEGCDSEDPRVPEIRTPGIGNPWNPGGGATGPSTGVPGWEAVLAELGTLRMACKAENNVLNCPPSPASIGAEGAQGPAPGTKRHGERSWAVPRTARASVMETDEPKVAVVTSAPSAGYNVPPSLSGVS